MNSTELDIVNKVASVLEVDSELLFHPCNKHEIVCARIISSRIMYMHYDLKMGKKEERIASILNLSRPNIIYYLKVHENHMETYPKYRMSFLACLNACSAMFSEVRMDLIQEYNNVPQL